MPRSAAFHTHKIALTAVLAKLAYQTPDVVQAHWQRFHQTKPIIPYVEVSEDILIHEFMQYVSQEPTFLKPSCPCEDTDVYIFQQQDTIYICFRGSSSFQDFAANIDIQRYCLFNQCSVPVPKGVTVHKGFYEQFRAIEHPLYDILHTALEHHPQLKICLCGHSLGAALTQIAAAHIASHPSFSHKVHVSCYTFGGPRVGNQAFVDWFAACVHENYRIVHQYDPIPNMPILPFWKHTRGLCICFNKKKQIYFRSNDARWYQRFFWLIKSIFPWSILNFQDHAMNVYVDRWIQLYSQTEEDPNDAS